MDHISIPITDTARTQAFYEACLAPLGWRLRGSQSGRYVGFDKVGSPVLYFGVSDTPRPVHLAFVANDEQCVRTFFEAALANGGKDNGPPGPRPSSGPAYYAAFVLDPDGHNIEAVVGGVHQAARPDAVTPAE
jgi:catechol 2,3-dioxygenase-like lactoylglutathione lyase family enzyme